MAAAGRSRAARSPPPSRATRRASRHTARVLSPTLSPTAYFFCFVFNPSPFPHQRSLRWVGVTRYSVYSGAPDGPHPPPPRGSALQGVGGSCLRGRFLDSRRAIQQSSRAHGIGTKTCAGREGEGCGAAHAHDTSVVRRVPGGGRLPERPRPSRVPCHHQINRVDAGWDASCVGCALSCCKGLPTYHF